MYVILMKIITKSYIILHIYVKFSYIYVTESAKIDHVGAKTVFYFIAQACSWTQELHNVSIGQCKLVCFSGGHFADPVKPQMCKWYL